MLYKGTMNGLWYPVRRDCPEIILPDGATATSITPGIMGAGHSSTFTAWAEICSTTEFGTTPLSLIGFIVTFRAGATLNTVDSKRVPRHVWLQVSNGSAGNETTNIIEERRMGCSAFVQLNGIVDDAVSALALGASVVYLEVSPKLLVSTRLSARNQWYDTETNGTNAIYAVAYDPSKLVWSNNPPIDFDAYLKGGGVFPGEVSDIAVVTSSSTAAQLSSYVNVPVNGNATLDADYLVTGMAGGTDYVGNAGHQIYYLALGSSGNEVVQARTAVGGAVFNQSTSVHTFKYPFIARKGEELRVAIKTTLAAANNHIATVNLTRLGVL